MKSFVPDYKMLRASTPHEVFKWLSNDAKVIAGGTDLMVLFESGRLPVGLYVDISKVQEWCGITVSSDKVVIGALTTYSEILKHDVLRSEFPMLGAAARLTGAVAIQNRGTIGGNIANASPAADTPPALLAYDAILQLESTMGVREVLLKDFYIGYKKMKLRPDEIIRSVTVPRTNRKYDHHFVKVGTRKAQAISKVCVAARILREGNKIADIRIGLGAVTPYPARAIQTEIIATGREVNDTLTDDVSEKIKSEISPIDDIRSNKEYRTQVCINIISEMIKDPDYARVV